MRPWDRRREATANEEECGNTDVGSPWAKGEQLLAQLALGRAIIVASQCQQSCCSSTPHLCGSMASCSSTET